jgi:beta-phosphoglucomutase-like phosphatase (HAD superfamily)
VAAERLGVDPRRCIAIEDSVPGVASAVAAGTITIAVPHQIDLPESDDYTRWPTLVGRTIDDVAALYRLSTAELSEPVHPLAPTGAARHESAPLV